MTEKNIRVVAQNCNDVNGFNIYLELSGRREYIMWHRHDGILFNVLKDGVYLNTLKREKPHKLFGSKRIAIQKRRICSSYDKKIKRIIKILDEYVSEEVGLKAC